MEFIFPKAVQKKTSCNHIIIYFRTSTMDNKAKSMRQRLKSKLVEKKVHSEKQAMKRVDGILTAEENHLIISEEPMSLNQMTILRRKIDPGYEPKEIGVPNKYGRYNMVPYAEALRRERNGTLNRNQSLTAFKLLSHIWDRKKGSFFTWVYLPQKLALSPPIESQYKPFQKHVSSY
jgi:hypothetical protein